MVDVVATLDDSVIAQAIKLAEIEVVRGAGGTPRGFRAHQNNLRRGRRTNEIRRTAPNRQTRQRKAARSNKPIFFQAPMPLRPADPPRSSVAPTKKPSNIGRNYQHHFKHSPNQLHQPNLSLENKTAGEQSTDSQKGSQIRRSKGGDRFPTSCSEEEKVTTIELKG